MISDAIYPPPLISIYNNDSKNRSLNMNIKNNNLFVDLWKRYIPA